MKRRTFVKTAATAVAASSIGRVYGANERVNVALIGCGGRGTLVAEEMVKADNVNIGAVCDVFQRNAEQARKTFGGTARIVKHFRDVLAMAEIDAVLISTPDHWHAIMAIEALEAGKHVYCEKPIEHTIQEGQAIVAAKKRYPNLVFLTGTQHRSAPHIAKAANMVQNGDIGDVHFVKVWNYSNSLPGVPFGADDNPPDDLDWDFYLGPAPKVPFDKTRIGADYRLWMDYSSGRQSDYGVHRFDSVHQIMGADRPQSCNATAHRYRLGGAGDHPDVLQATFEYPGWIMSYEALELNSFGSMARTTKGLPHHGSDIDGKNRPNGMVFVGTKGTLMVDRRALELIPEPGVGDSMQPVAEAHEDATREHAHHFVRCIRDGEAPRCDEVVGHRAGIVCHLANVSYKIGRKIQWDADKGEIVGDSDASKLMGKKARKPWDAISI